MKLSSVFTVATVSVATSAFTIPVSRVKHDRDSPKNPYLNKRESFGLRNIQDVIYTTKIQVGGKDLDVIIDTGSPDTWLHPTPETKSVYSGAILYNDLRLNITYGIGSIAGPISQLNIGLGSHTVQNQAILLVDGQENTKLTGHADGSLGVGFDTHSSIRQAVVDSGQRWGRTFLSNVFRSDPATPNHIAFRLDRADDGNNTDIGAFDIGSFGPGLEVINNTAAIPIFSTNDQLNKYWSVLVDGVTLNGQAQTLKSAVTNQTRIPPMGKVSALLDTGTSLAMLSPELVRAIYGAMGGVLINDGTNNTYAVPCMAEAQLVFNIGGHSIPIHPLDLTKVVATSWNNSPNLTVCVNTFQPIGSGTGEGELDFVLGDVFLRNVYSLYNYGRLVNGYSGIAPETPYIKLLLLTDAKAASAEFKRARAAQLTAPGMPPQVDPSTANDKPQALPASRNGAGRAAASLVVVGVAVVGFVAGLI